MEPSGSRFPLRTARLELRPFRRDDRAALLDLYRRPEVVRWLYTEPWSDADADREAEQRPARVRFGSTGDALTLALVEAAAGRLVGDLTLVLRSEVHRQGEIGFVLHPDVHGRGYATEGVRALLGFGFDAGLHRIYGRCDARNEPSARLMERAGMRREAHFHHDEWFKGGWSDTLVYALLEPAWRTAGEGPDERPR